MFYRKRLFDEAPEDSNYAPLPEDRPGGFNWGEEQVQQNDDENWMISPITDQQLNIEPY